MGNFKEKFKYYSQGDRELVNDGDLRLFKNEVDNSMQILRSPVGSAKIYQVKPKIITDLETVTLLNGWSVNYPRYRKMKVLADAGFPVIAIHPNQTGGQRELGGEQLFGRENIRKANLLRYALKEKEINRSNVIAVSGGSASSLIAASIEPGLIKDIVLITPNLGRQMRTTELAKRFGKKGFNATGMELRDPEVDMSSYKAGFEFFGHFAKNPGRAVREIKEHAEIDILTLCRLARQNGTRITTICATQDTLFPISEMYENLKNNTDSFGNILPSPFEAIYEVNGNHDEDSPLMQLRISLAASILKDMKKQ